MLKAFSQEKLPAFSAEITYFVLFDLVPSFNVDQERLEATFLKMQMKVHPDKFAQAEVSDQRNALAWASFINEAYEALSCPLSRALYLLKQAGEENVLETGKLKPEMMEKQFAWREALMDAEDVMRLKADVVVEKEMLLKTLAEAFQNKAYNQAKEAVVSLQFVEKFLKEIKKK